MLFRTMTWSSNSFILNPLKSVTTTGMKVKQGNAFQQAIILFLLNKRHQAFQLTRLNSWSCGWNRTKTFTGTVCCSIFMYSQPCMCAHVWVSECYLRFWPMLNNSSPAVSLTNRWWDYSGGFRVNLRPTPRLHGMSMYECTVCMLQRKVV